MDNRIALGIGLPKAATTYLAAVLAAHPEICFSSGKEHKFFDIYAEQILDAEKNASPGTDLENVFESLWKDFGPRCHRFRAEWTVSYIANLNALRAIKHFFRNSADPVFLLGIRDPIASVLSNYVYMALIRENSDAFKKSQLECMIQRPDIYLDPYDYYQVFKGFRQVFPHAKVLILPYRTISSKPSEFFADLFRCLQLNPLDGWSSIPPHNVSNSYRSLLIHRVVKWVSVRLYGDEQARLFLRSRLTDSEIPTLLLLAMRLNLGVYEWAPEAKVHARERLCHTATDFFELTRHDPNCIFVGCDPSSDKILVVHDK